MSHAEPADAYIHQSAGDFQGLWIGEFYAHVARSRAPGFTTLFLIANVSVIGGLRSWPVPRNLVRAVVALAILDTTGYVCFNIGVRHAPTSVVATASAPYALVPVLMGVSLLRERPSPVQWSGVGLVLVGLVLLGLTS